MDDAARHIQKIVVLLYPELKKKDRRSVEENLIRYVTVALAVADETYHGAAHLTHHKSIPKINERSIDNFKS
jgi:hypothetical protein